MLKTPRAIIAALGGVIPVVELTDASVDSVIGWKRKKTLPASKFLEMTEALRRKRQSAPASIWNQRHYRRPKNGKARR